MNTTQIKDNLKKVPKTNNANQNAKTNSDVLLAKQNLENLLGKTVQNTIVLDEQNQNKIQQIYKNQNNTNQNNKTPQTRKSNSFEGKKQNLKNKENNQNKENKENNQNLKMRNSEANKIIVNQNRINNVGQNFKKLPSKGLYAEMKKKINSITKNGKLIYNIDINEESQGNVDTNNKMPLFSNNKNVINNQGATLQKKHSNVPKEVDHKNKNAQCVVPEKDINQNIQNVKSHHQNNLQIKNKNESINNQNETIKTVKSIYFNQNDKTGNSNINQLCSQTFQSKAINEQLSMQSQNILDTKQIMPAETVKSIYQTKGLNQNSNVLSQLCIGQTAKSVYSGEVKENPYPGIMPNETVNSVYPIKESSNSINKNTQNLLSQMAPGATVKSVYPQQESQIKGLSQLLPAETVKSVYNKNESHTLFSQMVPGSVSKSIYTNKK